MYAFTYLYMCVYTRMYFKSCIHIIYMYCVYVLKICVYTYVRQGEHQLWILSQNLTSTLRRSIYILYVCMYIYTYDMCIYISYTYIYTHIHQGEDEWLNSQLETDEDLKKEVKNPTAVAEYCKIWLSVLQERAHEVDESQVYTATHCNTLQHIATTQCKTPRHIATQPCNIWLTVLQEKIPEVMRRRYTLKRSTAMNCNTLQHTATHCNILQHSTATSGWWCCRKGHTSSTRLRRGCIQFFIYTSLFNTSGLPMTDSTENATLKKSTKSKYRDSSVQPIPLGVTFSKAQSSKLERLFCHVLVKRDVRALSFELWNSIRKCHPKWDRLYKSKLDQSFNFNLYAIPRVATVRRID